MIVTCDSCGVQFRVDPEDLGEEGRRVRCGDCGHEWFQEPEDEELDSELEEAPEDKNVEEIMDEIQEAISREDDVPEEEPSEEKIRSPSVPQSQKDYRQFAKIAAALIFCLLISVLWFYKSAIGAIWPSTYAVYSLLGQEQKAIGINDVSFERFEAVQNGVELDIKGMIYNLKSAPLKLPPLILKAKNKDRQTIKEFIWEVEQPYIEAESILEIDKQLNLGNNTQIQFIELRPVTHIEHDEYLKRSQSGASSEG